MSEGIKKEKIKKITAAEKQHARSLSGFYTSTKTHNYTLCHCDHFFSKTLLKFYTIKSNTIYIHKTCHILKKNTHANTSYIQTNIFFSPKYAFACLNFFYVFNFFVIFYYTVIKIIPILILL